MACCLLEDKNIITWSKDCSLNWADFIAEINTSAFEDSSSNIRYHHTWKVDSEMIGREVYFKIFDVQLTTEFLKHLSWVRTQNASPGLLNHEQGHFDLAESMRPLFVEQINNKFKDSKFLTRGQNEEQRKQFAREDSGKRIFKELERCLDILSKNRKRYDEETKFGQNFSKQKEYDEKFRTLRI